MKLAIMQPYVFPYLGYYQLIHAVDKFVIYDDVNFIKRGWINRNNILVNGSANLFSIPLKNASPNRLIKDVELAEDKKWQDKFVKTIEHAYKKAPFYHIVYPMIKDVIMAEDRYINKMAILSLKMVSEYLEIKTIFQYTSTTYDNNELKKHDRVIDICKKENADHYINPIGGMEIYTKDQFEEHGINLSFIKMQPIRYSQNNEEFVPYLSIIDVLMFNEKDEVKEMLFRYELV
jgi:hypothetical protein